MGITNLRGSLENEIACHRGELIDLRKQIDAAKALIEYLPTMISRANALEETIEAAEKVIKFRTPDWNSKSVKPRRRKSHKNPIPQGETTPAALSILRERDGDPIKSRDLAVEALRRHGFIDVDRDIVDRVSDTIGRSLTKYEERGVVESIRGDIIKWVVAK